MDEKVNNILAGLRTHMTAHMVDTLRAHIEGLEAYVKEADRRVGEQFMEAQRLGAEALRQQRERLAEKLRAEAAEARVRELEAVLRCAPGGHSCEEFHHAKADRHLPGEPCPPMTRWHESIAALDAAREG